MAHNKRCQDEQKCEGFSLSSAPGDVYKMRIARPGEGKSGGYRAIVFFRSEERTFFEYGFAKSDRDNIDEGELKEFKRKAKRVLSFTDEEIRDQLSRRIYIEVL